MNAFAPIILLSALATGADPQRYSDPAMHFSLEIPDGWTRVSNEELEATTMRMGSVPAHAAGFRPSGRLAGTYPFVAISSYRGKLTPLAKLLETVRKAHSSAIERQKAVEPRVEFVGSEPKSTRNAAPSDA